MCAEKCLEREALRKGIEHLTVLFPTVVSSFDFQVDNSGRTVQHKLNAQSLRLFGLHSDVNDAHRAGANRLQNKTTIDYDLATDEYHEALLGCREARDPGCSWILSCCCPHSFRQSYRHKKKVIPQASRM